MTDKTPSDEVLNTRATSAAPDVGELGNCLNTALQVIGQYKSDLLYPPQGDSVGRRLEYASEGISAIDRARHILTALRGAQGFPFDEDDLEEIITDTLDMDWQPRWAARAIIRVWAERNGEAGQ